jgi:hypothetical protein
MLSTNVHASRYPDACVGGLMVVEIAPISEVEMKKTSVRLEKSLWIKLKMEALKCGKDAEVIVAEALVKHFNSAEAQP